MTNTSHPPRGGIPSPAAQLLHQHSVRAADVARALGVAPAVVSRMFSGATPATAALRVALAQVLDSEAAADAVYALCPDRRESRSLSPVASLLRRRGDSLAALARDMGVSDRAVLRWVGGQTTAPVAFRDQLRARLGEDANAAIAAVPRWRDILDENEEA